MKANIFTKGTEKNHKTFLTRNNREMHSNRKISKRCAHCHQTQKCFEGSVKVREVNKISIFCATYTCLSYFNIHHVN